MDEIIKLTNALNNFSFTSVDSTVTSSAIDAVLSFLTKAESHLASIVSSPPPSSSTITSRLSDPPPPTITSRLPDPPPPNPTTASNPISARVDLREMFLGGPLLEELKNDLPKMKYFPMSNNKDSPVIALFGDSPYAFNSVSKAVKPLPITPSSIMYKVLDTVNSKLGVNFNSVLVNKYRDKNTFLDWHKDDESVVDQNVPIATLSIGVARRFQISNNKIEKDRTEFLQMNLVENSILVMKPGLQESHFHRLAKGRGSKKFDERGIRYSITFRRLLPSPTAPVIPPPSAVPYIPPQPNTPPPQAATPRSAHEEPHADNHANCKNTLVFGSSLTGGLDCDLLSKRGKTFKVFTRGGARVETVIKMVEDAVDKNDVCPSCVEAIFLVVGGNDVENIKSVSGLEELKRSYYKLISVINSKFPAIRINILSLIPRRCRGYLHLQNIFHINDFLAKLCSNDTSNCYLIKMFTKYLLYKGLYYSNKLVYLNDNLFRKDKLHFSAVGLSILAKSLIAVANNPYY